MKSDKVLSKISSYLDDGEVAEPQDYNHDTHTTLELVPIEHVSVDGVSADVSSWVSFRFHPIRVAQLFIFMAIYPPIEHNCHADNR